MELYLLKVAQIKVAKAVGAGKKDLQAFRTVEGIRKVEGLQLSFNLKKEGLYSLEASTSAQLIREVKARSQKACFEGIKFLVSYQFLSHFVFSLKACLSF